MSIGRTIKLANRICAHAERGQTPASDVMRELAEGKRFLSAVRGGR